MEFRTIVEIKPPAFTVEPDDRILTVGSCFADHLGGKFRDEAFVADVNPYGVMYNPVSIVHTVERWLAENEAVPSLVLMTLGTNHVYRLKSTGEIVDNCQKRPQRLFSEEQLGIDDCAAQLSRAVSLLVGRNPRVKVVMTVSPIRYAKYGYHESQLSKATLLLAIDRLVAGSEFGSAVCYFPAYEIVNDELRDYRFYAPDMLHPSQQAVDYIWERFVDVFFSPRARQYLKEWKPIREALAHRPFNPQSEEYKAFICKTKEKKTAFFLKYGRNVR
ncbi:MAG: GSCFA domain-containing protein [Prevotella sp.]|nr:GSCFA domain-containing protein [Prevotella sp.]